MKDRSRLQSAMMRYPWKAMIVPAAFIAFMVGAAYTLYPFASSSLHRVVPETSTTPTGDIANPKTSIGSTPTGLTGAQYTAVIIETHLDEHMIPIILHFSSVLPPWWNIVLFTLEANWTMPSSSVFKRALADKKVSIHYLPSDTVLKNSKSVSRFLAKPWLWEQLQTAARILLFQTDSIICSNAAATVDDFVEYDFIGAPIDPKYGAGYNGGLSIRNPSLFLRITQEVDFDTSGQEFEDQWFYKEAKLRVDQGVRLAEVDVAKTFSVETIYYEKPLGYHQAARWQKDNMQQVEAWCPEVKMLIGRRAV